VVTLPHRPCLTCGCATHAAPQTWEVTCAACGELRWPVAIAPPAPDWLCSRCRATPPETRARRQRTAQRAAETRQARAVMGDQTSSNAAGARLMPSRDSQDGARRAGARIVMEDSRCPAG
jgi:hypothetical protein